MSKFLAVHDLPRARKLVNGPAGEGANRYLSMLAMRMARTDTKTALALVAEMKADQSSYRALTQMAVARRVAERDPAEAVRILDRIDDPGYKTRYQAEGLAHVAVVVAPRDRNRAGSLIDRCFDSAAHDRVWLDLDRDGRFDPLTEQFPLGKPLAVTGKTFLVKPEPDGGSVRVRGRPAATGQLRLLLTDGKDMVPQAIAIDLVSDWGELVTVTTAKDAVSLPVARYAVDSIRFQLTDTRGRRWQYHFGGPRRFDIEVTAGPEKVVSLLSGLRLTLDLKPADKLNPGDDVYVTPSLNTPSGMYLVNCEQFQSGNDDFASSHADIHLCNTGGDMLAREQSGFM